MSETPPASGAIARAELAELAELFDRFSFAFDPLSADAKQAESLFNDRVRELYDKRVASAYEGVDFTGFVAHVRTACRAHLRANP